MKIGFVGLGKMGNQIVTKLLANDHEVVAYDVNRTAVAALEQQGAIAADSREDLVAKLGERPILWLMIPSQFVGAEVDAYLDLLPQSSILIDGGNTNFNETLLRGAKAAERGIRYVDVGTSGGIHGLQNGFSLMIGGEKPSVQTLAPVFDVLVQPHGRWIHAGETGSGHYVKMIHNGIEYALMQAYAEGYDLLKNGKIQNLDLAAIADVWQGGSIIASNLNALAAEILHENPNLEGVEGFVAASGEGRWTYDAAQEAHIDMPALREALAVRDASAEGRYTFATKLLASLRNKFGGHAINK